MTLGTTFLKCPMYLLHLWMSTVLQNCSMLLSCSLVCGLTSLLRYSFMSCDKFSIALRWGYSGSVFHQLIPFSPMKISACLDVCLGSLSCISLCRSGNTSLRNGTNALSRIIVYSGPFIFPSKMQILVLPLALIPAQTWTFVACFALQGGGHYLTDTVQ